MPQKLNIVAQYAMDEYLGAFADSTTFFTVQDFIFHVSASLSAIYQAEYKLQYAELRQDKSESVVTFSADWLLEQEVKVEIVKGERVAKLLERPMSFPFDKQVVGIQSVTSRGRELMRSNATEVWQYPYLPMTDEIFWRYVAAKMKFFTNGECNIQDATILYVPQMNTPESDVPDGVIKQAIEMTVGNMKQLLAGVVVKDSDDLNQNKTLQTEINKRQLK